MLRQTKRDKIYTMCRSGELKAFLFGRTWLIDKEYFDKMCIRDSSTTGGSPFVINNMDSLFEPNSNSYNLFSEDLANWGYINLTAGPRCV